MRCYGNTSRYSPAARKFISREVEHLMRDKGYDQTRAVAAAHDVARRKGYKVPPVSRKKNPNLIVYGNPHDTKGLYHPMRRELPLQHRVDVGRVAGQIAENVHAILYEHANDGLFYEHEFEPGVQAFALQNGDILLSRRDGRPLWGEF